MWWDNLKQPICKNASICKYKETNKCVVNCYWYYLVNVYYKHSGIPESLQGDIRLIPEEIDLPAFVMCKQYEDAVIQHVNNGNGLYIHSNNVGNGKTSWALKILQRFIRETSMRGGGFTKPVGYYVNVSELFETLRMNMENKDITLRIERDIQNADLVIFDDMGAEVPTTWVKNKLYNYINYRYMNKKAMIITSNLTVEQLGGKLDKRIADRISEVCRPIHIQGISRRHAERWWEDDRASNN